MMMYPRRTSHIFLAFLVVTLMLHSWIAYSQIATPDVGAQPNRSYSGGEFDHIQLQNGNLFLQIPLESFPQRGRQKLSYSLIANGPQWHPNGGCDAIGNCSYVYSVGGVLCGSPSGFSPYVTRDQGFGWCANNSTLITDAHAVWNAFQIIDKTGATHPLGTVSTDYSTLQATDGSGYKLKLDSSGYNVTEAYDSSGLKQVASSGGLSFIDPMGINSMTYDSSTGILTDTVGRTISEKFAPTDSDVSACPDLGVSSQTANSHTT